MHGDAVEFETDQTARPAIHRPRVEVTPFEDRLLRLLTGMLRGTAESQMAALAGQRVSRPKCLHRDAVRLIENRLSRGVVALLCRAGGWKTERFLRGGAPRGGSLWERTTIGELRLEFSRHALELLMWMTASDLTADRRPPRQSAATAVTTADQLLYLIACHALRHSAATRLLFRRAPFCRDGLFQLMFPDALAAESWPKSLEFDRWLSEPGSSFLECLQSLLAQRWVDIETWKAEQWDWSRVQEIGHRQERVLEAFLDAVHQAGRRDLSGFVLEAAGKLLSDGSTTYNLPQSPPGSRLIDRAALYRGRLAFLHQFARLRRWEREARNSAFYDEDYQASQFWLSEWERRGGTRLCERAAGILREWEPFGE